MRSPELNKFYEQLSELNNHFSHYIFVWEQFHIDNKITIAENKTELTTSIYSENKNARQFRVKLENLESTNLETNSFILRSLYVLAYSQFEIYMRELYEFCRKMDQSLPNLKIKERIPDTIFEHLEIDTATEFEQQEILTFDYLRLRRNRIVHSGDKSAGDLADLKRQKGNSLNRFWNGVLKKGLIGLDFQSENVTHFEKREIFDVINIYRKLIKKTDQLILQKIGRKKIIERLKKEFIETNESLFKGWGEKRTNKKFVNYCRMEFDLILKIEEFNKIKVI
ncbi:hypothetical protein LDL76_12440 [Salegentibacter mishustinae]|uniref:hypothetical protein n=1 Tax=Salegentibacter mishustinae TaxID=270918 RepID=UPI001CE21D67|nr:hypothetical protein [Salegentibacter mishustinae]UBZ06166.1 hypothetical protein LDL76_12440 [Salegentibacter mishustinae]